MGTTRYYAYIGTNSVRGSKGIYIIEVDPEHGAAVVKSTIPAYNSGAVALNPTADCLYAVTEGMTFDGYAQGGVTAFSVAPDGSLAKLNGQPSHGQRTCCLDVTDKAAYAGNFIFGTWCSFPFSENGALKPAELVVGHPRKDAMRTGIHGIGVIENDFVGVISIEHNELIIYRAEDGSRFTSYSFPERTMPRTFIVVDNLIYVLLQMPDEVFVFESHLKTDGIVELVQRVKMSDEQHPRMGGATAIRATPDHRYVIAASSPAGAVAIFSRNEDGTLKLERTVALQGQGTRDFNLSQDGALLVAAMQRSDEVCIMRVDYEKLELIPVCEPIKVPSPAAVAVSGRKEV